MKFSFPEKERSTFSPLVEADVGVRGIKERLRPLFFIGFAALREREKKKD